LGNQLDALPASYERFLANGPRAAFDLPGVPIRISEKTNDNPYAGKGSRQK
jgi:GTPase